MLIHDTYNKEMAINFVERMTEFILTCHTALTVWVASNWKKPGFLPF